MESSEPGSATPLTEEEVQKVFFKAADAHLREGSYFHSELIAARIDVDMGDANLPKLMYAWAKSREYPLLPLFYRHAGGLAMIIVGMFLAFVSLGLSGSNRGPGAAVIAFLAILSIGLIVGGWVLFKKARQERKQHIERANTICPECDEAVDAATGVCPCGYLNTAPGEMVPEDKFQTAWKVETPAGPKTFETLSGVRTAILDGSISRSMTVVQIKEEGDSQSGEDAKSENAPQALTVDDVAAGSFELRSLYQPIWAHTMRGLWIGIVVGVSLWLAQLAITMFSVANNPIIGGVIVVFLILIVQGVLSAKMNWVVSRILWGAIPFIIAMMIVNFGIGTVIRNIGRGLTMQFGAVVAGALFGGLLGMMIGTIVGLIRKDKVQLAPDATDEGRDPLIKGLLIPSATFVVLVLLYVYLFVPWMVGVIERNA